MVFTAGLLVGGGPTFNSETMALYGRTSILGPPPLSFSPLLSGKKRMKTQ